MSAKGQAFEQAFHDEHAIWLQWGVYEAAVLPAVGANLIAFREQESHCKFLREPDADEMDIFRENPGVHGIPVLFPPNRYEDGTFTMNGRTYTFPINEPKTGNSLHGFVHNAVWRVEDYGANNAESYVALSITVDHEHPIYTYLPHRFTIKLRYSLSDNGLAQQVSVHNEGSDSMPCLIGFHTAINAPFAPESRPEDYRFTLTTGQRWELNERMLPTGNILPLSDEEVAMKSTGISPFWEPMDHHYTAEPINGRNVMQLTDTCKQITLTYEVDNAYKQWMVWNNDCNPGFFCPEPQLNLVNAPNVDLPADTIGLVTLAPGAVWEAESRLYVKR